MLGCWLESSTPTPMPAVWSRCAVALAARWSRLAYRTAVHPLSPTGQPPSVFCAAEAAARCGVAAGGVAAGGAAAGVAAADVAAAGGAAAGVAAADVVAAGAVGA